VTPQPGPVPGYALSDDPARLDLAVVHGFLTEAYWSEGRSREVVERTIQGSALCMAAYDAEGRQVGFTRVVSDGVTFAWICDVFVLEEHRGRGIAKWMVTEAMQHPRLRRVGRWVLATRDAHEVYRAVGFEPLERPERWMEQRPG
jgi:GNAT superfamily N-acetyltransferase